MIFDAPARYRYHLLLARGAALLATAVGIAVLAGWAFDISWLRQLYPDTVPMKANTALTFTLAGFALWRHTERRSAGGLSAVLATFVALVGVLTFAEYLFPINLGIDELLFREPHLIQGLAAGRMSPVTAFCFASFGLALLATPDRLGRIWRELPALFTILLSLVAVMGYLYDVKAMYAFGPHGAMALHTSVVFLLLGIGLLFAYPERGTMAVLVGDTIGGAMARRMLPVAVIVPITIGWLRLLAERAGFHDPALGLSLVVVATIISMSVVVIRNAGALAIEEVHRRKAAEALLRANRRLEQTVAERTRALSERELQLREANRELQLLSLEDPLTGVSNRRGFELALERESRLTTRHHGLLSLIMIDIDHFKAFNDHYGHLGGDGCLRRVAAELRGTLSRPGDMVARYGGEEFVAILPNTPDAGAGTVAHLMRSRIENLGIPHAQSPKGIVSISIGIATSTAGEAFTAEELLASADKALYEAKRLGRDRVQSAELVRA